MKHKARQAMCERRQPRSRPQVAPQPPVHTCATPDEYRWEQYAKRHQRTFGHPPSRDAHAGKLVQTAEHEGTPAPEGERIGGRLVIRPSPPPAWVARVIEDPYATEGE